MELNPLKTEPVDDTSLYDNSRIADTTTASALADLGITMAQPAVVTGMLFEEKMDNTMVGELARPSVCDFMSVYGAPPPTSTDHSVQQTVQRVCFEEQMMRQLLKLVKQGELVESEHCVLRSQLASDEDISTINNHLNTYHAVKQTPDKYDQSTCEQLINMFKETIESTWQSMSESERSDFSRSALDLDDDIFREEQKRKRKPRGPKRPSAYNLYLRDHKELMRADNPDWTPSEVNKRVGLNWKHATNDVKNEYKKKALDMATSSLSTAAAAVASAVEEAITVN